MLGFARLDELETKMIAAPDNSSYRCAECEYVHKKRIQVNLKKDTLFQVR
jgi:hypothetical protein